MLSLQEGQVLECSLINSIRQAAIPKVNAIGGVLQFYFIYNV
jgi:hypothetical protein